MTKRIKWSNEEINILNENYDKGVDLIVNLLPNHTKNSIKKKANRLGLIVNRDRVNYDYDEVLKAVEESISFAEVFRKLDKTKSGDSYKALKGYINRNNIDTSHFNPYVNNRIIRSVKDISEWLQWGTNIGSSDLKRKIYKEGLKERKCELCGQGEEWMGKKMSLILDHINGISNDNRLENLRIVCPNCNATLDTHCKGYKKDRKVKSIKEKKPIVKKKKEKKEFNRDEFNISQRKVERPSLELLLTDIKELGYRGTGKKYSVSDNSIRKWIKNYNKQK